MRAFTYYVALPFAIADDRVTQGAVDCLSANLAIMRAETLSRKPGCAGAVAFSRTKIPAAANTLKRWERAVAGSALCHSRHIEPAMVTEVLCANTSRPTAAMRRSAHVDKSY